MTQESCEKMSCACAEIQWDFLHWRAEYFVRGNSGCFWLLHVRSQKADKCHVASKVAWNATMGPWIVCSSTSRSQGESCENLLHLPVLGPPAFCLALELVLRFVRQNWSCSQVRSSPTWVKPVFLRPAIMSSKRRRFCVKTRDLSETYFANAKAENFLSVTAKIGTVCQLRRCLYFCVPFHESTVILFVVGIRLPQRIWTRQTETESEWSEKHEMNPWPNATVTSNWTVIFSSLQSSFVATRTCTTQSRGFVTAELLYEYSAFPTWPSSARHENLTFMFQIRAALHNVLTWTKKVHHRIQAFHDFFKTPTHHLA